MLRIIAVCNDYSEVEFWLSGEDQKQVNGGRDVMEYFKYPDKILAVYIIEE